MTMKPPRKDRARWLEGAPEFVAAIRDNGGKTADRYTVYLTGSLALTAEDPKDQPRFDRVEEFLAMSGSPTHPQGFSQFGEAPRGNRRNSGKTIRWLDLPEHIRAHVVARCTNP